MDKLCIAPTPSTPEVDFEFALHRHRLRGESYPENAAAFYGDILPPLRAYLATCTGQHIELQIALAYFNSSSTKMLFNMIESLSGAVDAGGNRVTVHWLHDEDDDTMREFGEELRDDFPAIAFEIRPLQAG